jgi:dTDP-4-amino-4,6-dideoxygalactose transaminase
MLSFGRDKLLDCVSGGALVVRNAAYVDKVQSPAHLASRTNRLRDRWYPLLMWLARTTYPIYLGPLLTRFYRATRMVVRTADGSIDILAAMPSWQAKRAQQKLNDLAADIDRRQQLAALYREKLPSLFHPTDAPVRLPFLAKNRDNVWRRLQRAGYHMSDTWYDTPIGPARLYGKVNYPETRCPTAAEVAARIINLPTHRYINVDHATRIAEIVLESQRESA